MKVKDLIAQLKTMDQDLYVICYTEDEALLAKGHMFRVLEIDGADVIEGQMTRGKDNIGTLKLGSGPGAKDIACLNVTSDF